MHISLRRRGDGSWQQRMDFTLVDLFGQRKAYEPAPGFLRIIRVLLTDGLYVSGSYIASKTQVNRRYANRVRKYYLEELEKLLVDAKLLGYTNLDLAIFLECGTGEDFVTRLRALYEQRGEEPYGLLPSQFGEMVQTLWEEYREAKAYQGCPPDALEVRVPRWFVEEELGFGFTAFQSFPVLS